MTIAERNLNDVWKALRKWNEVKLISEELNLSRQTVGKWIKYFRDKGLLESRLTPQELLTGRPATQWRRKKGAKL